MAAKSNSQQDYLKNLLGKHESKGRTAESYLKKAEAGYEAQIKMGRYEIKQGASVPHRKTRSISKMEAENMNKMKKSLQQNLELIDSRIGQLTDPDKKKVKIDDKERRKFVSQMVKGRRQLEKKRQAQLQEQIEKQKHRIESQQKERKKKQEEENSKKKQQIMKRVQSMEVNRKTKREEFENQKKLLKAKMEEKILSERMMQKFKEAEAVNLQAKKRRLAQIRSLHKPLTKSEFELHLDKIEKLKSQRSRVNEYSSRYMTGNTSKFYKSSWYKKAKEEPIKFEDDAHEQELYQVKQMKDKLKKYAEYVRQNFRPQISKKKMNELANKNKSAPIVKTEDLRELGLKYLQYSKEHVDPNKKEQEDEDDKPKAFKHHNYLEDIKKNSKGTKSAHEFVEHIKHKKGISNSEKAQKILDYVEGLERKAKMKEQKDKINHVMLDQELDNLYMEAIAVKLSMLGKEQNEDNKKE